MSGETRVPDGNNKVTDTLGLSSKSLLLLQESFCQTLYGKSAILPSFPGDPSPGFVFRNTIKK